MRFPGGAIGDVLALQRGHLFPWMPVALAVGIGLYFALGAEPAAWLLAGAGMAALAGLGWSCRSGASPFPPLLALALVAGGFAIAGARAHLVAAPVLSFRYYGPIEGRIVDIDRSASDAVRLTLDRVVLARTDPDRTPARVRVALHGAQDWIDPVPGMTVILTGHLAGPGGPAEPGGFDFRRHAWFLGLGAQGYTRTPVLALAPPDGGVPVFTARRWLAERVTARLPGETGAFAAAILAGDRSAIPRPVTDDLRRSNLAHLLAISGLHMGLLAGVVFASLRVAFLLVPGVGLRWPVKKIAAAGAILCGAGYLVLSGGNVATERAFVMVAVAFAAVMLDRRALSLRSVAFAALIVLVRAPEALLSPGFQMSFAATVALVAVFTFLRDAPAGWRLPRAARPLAALVLSSAVAGAATGPVAMAHFNMVSHYGLLANLAAVPVMGAVVMPAAVAALVLMPVGLDWIAFAVMGLGLDWILWVARSVADWPGAVGQVMAPPPAVLPMLALSALFVALWQGRLRWAGILPVLLAAALWTMADRPVLLVSEDGALVGAMTDTGRALSRARGSGFVAELWLENDGDGADQERAAARWRGEGAPLATTAGTVRHVRGARAAAAFDGCAAGEIVVSDMVLPGRWPCIVEDAGRRGADGAVAYRARGGRVERVTARDLSGDRLWNPAPRRGAAALALAARQ
ncbi:ComEC/Rec2 family competence protein [Roseivivax isoporae]|uniref:Competence protein n=1 Tax=Roseivivax isoporae LMG 25204 TaxID=1449351 RepID=X7FFG9_9RHOB|nr:ComEC/Rec2 family competence protein [Roseivivax isoporae]ETX30779.1 competence protein [Roseivivax isoporae LMG 25204]